MTDDLAPMMPSVDTHHHLWDAFENSYPYLTDGSRDRMHGKPLPRVYRIEHYLQDARPVGVKKSVHIQCGWDPTDPVGETRWLEGIAQQHGFPHGIVAHADLAAADVESLLAAHCAASPRLRGIRQHVGWHENPRYRLAARPDMLTQPEWRRGFGLLQRFNLSFELQAFYPQFETAAELADEFPATPILLGNAGMPVDREPEALAAWRAALRPLARRPNVFCKLGGFAMVDHHWTIDTIRPFVDELIDVFGVERCMFGSNFPVDSLYRDFASMWRDYHQLIAAFSADERRQLLHDNAVRVYRLRD